MNSPSRRIALCVAIAGGLSILPAQQVLSQQSLSRFDEVVWRNVTRDRALNSTYRNLVTHPIQISVSTRSGDDGKRCVAKLWINDVEVAYQFVNSGGGRQVCSVTGMVPIGASYEVDTDTAKEVELELWSEFY